MLKHSIRLSNCPDPEARDKDGGKGRISRTPRRRQGLRGSGPFVKTLASSPGQFPYLFVFTTYWKVFCIVVFLTLGEDADSPGECCL